MPINNFQDITTTGFDEDALVTATVGDRVRNFAVVTTTGDLANGIYAGANNVSVDNLGRIETSGRGAEGVLIEGAGARVRNFGTIVTHGEPTDDFFHFNDAIAVYGNLFKIDNWGNLSTEDAFSSGTFSEGDGGLIRNFGSIRTSGDFSPALVVIGDDFHVDNWGRLETHGLISQGMVAEGNAGLLRNFGDIHIVDPSAPAMDATGSQNEVVNLGTITGAGMFAGGVTVLSGSGNTLTNWGSISTDDLAMVGTGRGALVQNHGTIEALFGIGMLASGEVAPEGRNSGTIVTGGDNGDGLHVEADADGKAVNTGSIRTEGDGGAGVFLISVAGGQATNSGSIETFGGILGVFAAAGVDAYGLDVLVRNTAAGSIETHDPDSPAAALNIRDVPAESFRAGFLAADTQSRLENEGLIKAVQTAVLGGAGDDTVINSGEIIGDVRLGGGDDTYIAAKRGALLGAIFGGDGADSIVFHNGSGETRVGDFEAGAAVSDVLDVSAFCFDSFADVLDAAQQDGSDVVIGLDNNDRAVLSGVSLAALHENDFLLA
jgi:hypothetical protein